MEDRKNKEKEYYEQTSKTMKGFPSDSEKYKYIEGFDPFLLKSYSFLKALLKNKCFGKKLLDFGCGNGIHSLWLASFGAKVIGIDISSGMLALARAQAINAGLQDKIEFLLMDAEDLKFQDNSFDIVFDGNSFSSVDVKKVLPQIVKILKPDGILVGIETLGHNPLINLKREFNRLRGIRTDWATSHIFKVSDIEELSGRFEKTEVYYFHLVSCLAISLINFSGAKILVKILEAIDTGLFFVFPFFKKYSFKVVFVFSHPRK